MSTKAFIEAEKATPVSFAMVNDSYYRDNTLEPGMVRERKANSGHLYLESSFTSTPSEPVTECVVSSPNNAILLSGAKRAGVVFASFYHGTPTINESNNIIQCYDVATSTVWTFILTIGDWVTPQQLITQLQLAKTASGCTVQFQYTFKGATPPPYLSGRGPTNDKSVLLVTDTPIMFLPNSSGVLRGDSTFAFQSAPTGLSRWDGINPVNAALQAEWTPYAVTEQMMGPMSCAYSRYLDIYSSTLAKWSKRYSLTTSSNNNNHLFRLGLGIFDGYDSDPGVILINDDRIPAQVPTPIIYEEPLFQFAESPNIPVYFNLNPSESITAIDFKFLDEYGNRFVSMQQINSVNPGVTISTRSALLSRPVDNRLRDGGIYWEIGLYIEQ